MNLSMHKRMYIILTFSVLYIIYMCMGHGFTLYYSERSNIFIRWEKEEFKL